MNISELPKLCYSKDVKCPFFRDCDWIEETGLCIFNVCIKVYHSQIEAEVEVEMAFNLGWITK